MRRGRKSLRSGERLFAGDPEAASLLTRGLIAVAMVALFRAAPVSATVSSDAVGVQEVLDRESATEVRSTAAFLEAGQVLEVPLVPATPLRCGLAIIIADRRTTVDAVGAPLRDELEHGLEFEPSDRTSPAVATSENGLVIIDACREREPAERVLLRMGSPRGAVTVFTASLPLGENTRVSELVARALDRVDGPSSRRADLGPPLSGGPFPSRKRRGRQRALRLGATNVLSTEATADPTGEGTIAMTLTRGCHTVRVMSAESLPRDVDAELWDAELERRFARDRSDLPDAHLSACVTTATAVAITWKGASPEGRVVIEDEITPIGEGIPSAFGAQAEASIAKLFHEREAPMPTVQPFSTALGSQGATELHLAVEPNRCYVAAITLSRGTARGLRVSAGDAARPSLVEVPRGVEAASVHFCAQRESALIHVDVPGASITWLLAVWLVGAEPHDPAMDVVNLLTGPAL